MATTFRKFDAASYLADAESVAAFVADALETEDAGYIANAIGIAAKAKGMTALAQETGLSREQLYRSFSDKGNPTLKSVLAVTKALGIKITART
ncbi:addiction module antidote protein [Idiomarina aminovorans]|uniref:addiction module antidote protein n=1 Tax=Idiomarina aminovorans TaxID=2914829 RepID=UPI0020045571|nr:addiction module antidote protein [Idiomarina sp. ATCH4]MCK7459181.1 putative addiction module antidote protein [Idiomarina sp. ATCH4]